MQPDRLFPAIVGISLLNGLASPFLTVVFALTPTWMPHLFPGITELLVLPELVFYASSIMVATVTLLVSGVPAALYERIAGLQQSDTVSMLIWLAGAAFLSIPAALRLLG